MSWVILYLLGILLVFMSASIVFMSLIYNGVLTKEQLEKSPKTEKYLMLLLYPIYIPYKFVRLLNSTKDTLSA